MIKARQTGRGDAGEMDESVGSVGGQRGLR